jgi:hypothetical protein
MTDEVAFFMGSQVVGEFSRNRLPTMDGSYSYEPLRTPGHLNLHIELADCLTLQLTKQSAKHQRSAHLNRSHPCRAV